MPASVRVFASSARRSILYLHGQGVKPLQIAREIILGGLVLCLIHYELFEISTPNPPRQVLRAARDPASRHIHSCLARIEPPTAFHRETHTLLKVSSPCMTAMASPGVCQRSKFSLTSLSKLAVNGEDVESVKGTCRAPSPIAGRRARQTK